ncbi:adenylate/guanylate cyclase domain-containing protein [Simkania sp.]|uniref:adenylate/guanylate cyclase domain-containing protein n=1 Tax=Simkania sp. TaxID=34094 RepID=UPI003B51D990
MKFRTKLFYSFISLGLMSTLLALFIIYGEASRLIFNEIRSKILSLVSNTVQLIDPSELQTFVDSKGNKDQPAYQDLKRELFEIRNLNRRTDVYVQYVYILRKIPDSDRYFFVIDAEEGRRFLSEYGDPFPASIQLPPDPRKAYVTKNIYSDAWGTWITGYAPIFDAQGKEIGLLGIDVRTKEIYMELEKLLLYGLIAFAISIFVGIVFAYFLSKLVSSSLSVLCDTVKQIGKGEFNSRSPLHTRDEFNELSIAINTMAKGLEERERLKMGFARYVSQYALEELLKLDKPITLEGERKKVTILFSDIRQFTTIAEKLPPEEVLKLLNEYFKEMIEVIFNYGGTLDKFIGDGLMVEFGAPLDDKLQELHAVLAAIHMQLRLNKLCEKWAQEGRDQLSMGIGIHTGLAVLGNIGSERRMEYTAIGDTVNVASRLEWLTKRLQKPIIISKPVYDKVKDHFVFEDLNETKLPGRMGNTQVYAIHPQLQENLSQVELAHEFHNLPEEHEE